MDLFLVAYLLEGGRVEIYHGAFTQSGRQIKGKLMGYASSTPNRQGEPNVKTNRNAIRPFESCHDVHVGCGLTLHVVSIATRWGPHVGRCGRRTDTHMGTRGKHGIPPRPCIGYYCCHTYMDPTAPDSSPT